MKAIGLDYIDYWQSFCLAQQGLKNHFGLRLKDGRCWALIQIGNEEACTFGKPHDIPVDLWVLPSYLRMIVEDYQLNYPNSDLIDILTGKKSVREGLRSQNKIGVKRMAAAGAVPLPNAS